MHSCNKQHASKWGERHIILKSATGGAVMAKKKRKSNLNQAALSFEMTQMNSV